MKKIFALVAVALLGTIGAFAFDLSGIEGTWKDETYNANWTFNGGGTITLTDASTGAVYFTFNDSNTSEQKAEASLTDGATISFYCKETGRHYRFTKPVALNAD